MIRMEALRELGGYNEAYRYASDYDLVCRLVLYGKVENLPDILMIYRCHPDQISQKRMRLQQMYAEQIRTHYRLSFSECYGGTSFGYLDAHSLRDEELGKIITLYIYARYKADGALERDLNFIRNKQNLICLLSYLDCEDVRGDDMYHSRNENSWFADLANERRNRVEYLNVCGMDRAALLEYIRSWSL